MLDEVRYDTVFAAAYSPRPGTPALHMADDVPAADKRRRLNELLARQETIGLACNREWLGRDVEVLVEQVTRQRGEAGEGSVNLAGRTRHNKLVHLTGDPRLVGRAVTVRIEHAGPYALRGRVVGPGT